MADPYVRQASGVFTGTVGSTNIGVGDAVYFDGTDWELADADDNTKYTEGIAVNNVDTGEIGIFCRKCIIVDIDAPYTQGDQYFLSATAGEITKTRPTGDNNLIQVLGFGISTRELAVDIKPVTEHHVWLTNTATTATETGGVQYASGNFGAYTMDADDEDVFFTVEIPQNCVGLEIAHLWHGPDAIGNSPLFDVSVSGAKDDEAHANTTPDTSLTNTTAGATADDIYKTDISGAFNATDIFEAGNCLGIKVTEKSGTSDPVPCFGINMVFKVV